MTSNDIGVDLDPKQRVSVLKRKDDDGLPPGVNRELSPYWDLHKNPVVLFKHCMRYVHLAHTVSALTRFDKDPDQQVVVWDIAAGMGEMWAFLRGMRKAKGTRVHYYGLEIDPWKIERANQYLGSSQYFHLIKRDITRPLPKNLPTADVAISTETLEHIERADAIKLIRRLQRRGVKYFIGSTPVPSRGREKYSNPDDRGWHRYEFGHSELRKIFKKYGWKVHFFGYFEARYNSKDWPWWINKNVIKQCAGLGIAGDPVPGSVTFFVLENRDAE